MASPYEVVEIEPGEFAVCQWEEPGWIARAIFGETEGRWRSVWRTRGGYQEGVLMLKNRPRQFIGMRDFDPGRLVGDPNAMLEGYRG